MRAGSFEECDRKPLRTAPQAFISERQWSVSRGQRQTRKGIKHGMSFIHEEFLLQSRTARRLYHQFAEKEPIFDYHCHLSPRDIAENRQFKNLCEIWLEGDHYKWRAMRANGVAERFVT